MRIAFVCMAMLAGCATTPNVGTRATVLSVDDQQRAMVAAADVAGLDRLAHPNLLINSPGGRVLTREQFLANMRSGEIAAEGFERTAEKMSISGNVAVVMGRETFTPLATSELSRTYGSKPLQRRYTNITSGIRTAGYGWPVRRTCCPLLDLRSAFDPKRTLGECRAGRGVKEKGRSRISGGAL